MDETPCFSRPKCQSQFSLLFSYVALLETSYNQEESWFPTQLIAHSLPRGYRPSPRLRRFTQGRAFFLRVSRSPTLRAWHFAFPGRFFFPGCSRFLAIPASWRFPCPGDSQHVTSWRAVVWSYFNFNSKSVPGCFWCPRASSFRLFSAPPCLFLLANRGARPPV